jgi:hypothetical protein
VQRTLWTVLAGLCLASPIAAQTPPRVLVNQPINEAQRTMLHGNVSPLAQPQYDQGRVSDSLPASRVLLMLNRPPEREAALQQYLLEVHSKGSTTYHHWITPQQFGEQFGLADTDVQAVTDWLGSKGFRITKISQGKQFIELSGTAGQLQDAFQAEIHQYNVNGELHYANAHEISVPTALAQVVRGLVPLIIFAQSLISRWREPVASRNRRTRSHRIGPCQIHSGARTRWAFYLRPRISPLSTTSRRCIKPAQTVQGRPSESSMNRISIFRSSATFSSSLESRGPRRR